MYKIVNFSFVNGDIKGISFCYNVLDTEGRIIKSNIRKSIQVGEGTLLEEIINTGSILDVCNALVKFLETQI